MCLKPGIVSQSILPSPQSINIATYKTCDFNGFSASYRFKLDYDQSFLHLNLIIFLSI